MFSVTNRVRSSAESGTASNRAEPGVSLICRSSADRTLVIVEENASKKLTFPSAKRASCRASIGGAILIIYEACSGYWHRQNGVWSFRGPGLAFPGGGGGRKVPGRWARKSFTSGGFLSGQLRRPVLRRPKPPGPLHRRRHGHQRRRLHAV